MAGCGHGMPTPAACTECMDEGNIPPRPALKREGWPFVAQLVGTVCSGCGIEVDPGDRIVRMSDDTYRHAPACEKIRRG